MIAGPRTSFISFGKIVNRNLEQMLSFHFELNKAIIRKADRLITNIASLLWSEYLCHIKTGYFLKSNCTFCQIVFY